MLELLFGLDDVDSPYFDVLIERLIELREKRRSK